MKMWCDVTLEKEFAYKSVTVIFAVSQLIGMEIMKRGMMHKESKFKSKHVLYSVNTLRNCHRRNCCKEITENRRIIVRPHREVIISVVIGSAGQPF